MSSLRLATENAFGLKESRPTSMLRFQIIFYGMNNIWAKMTTDFH